MALILSTQVGGETAEYYRIEYLENTDRNSMIFVGLYKDAAYRATPGSVPVQRKTYHFPPLSKATPYADAYAKLKALPGSGLSDAVDG